jgi:hypothetical protein
MDLPESLDPLLDQRLRDLSPESSRRMITELVKEQIVPKGLLAAIGESFRSGLLALSPRRRDREAAGKPRTRTVRRTHRESAHSHLLQVFQHGAKMRIHLIYFSDSRSKWMPPLEGVTIRPGQMKDVIDLWAGPGSLAAALELATSFLENYQIPNIDDWLKDAVIDILELNPNHATL